MSTSPPPSPQEERPAPALTTQDRITVQQAVHFEHFGDNPTSMDGAYSRLLGVQEEPFRKKIQLTSKWIRIDDLPYCWVELVGFVFIKNMVGVGDVSNPTEEERQRREGLNIRIVTGIYPGADDPAYPLRPYADQSGLLLRPRMSIFLPIDPEASGVWARSDTDEDTIPATVLVVSR